MFMVSSRVSITSHSGVFSSLSFLPPSISSSLPVSFLFPIQSSAAVFKLLIHSSEEYCLVIRTIFSSWRCHSFPAVLFLTIHPRTSDFHWYIEKPFGHYLSHNFLSRTSIHSHAMPQNFTQTQQASKYFQCTWHLSLAAILLISFFPVEQWIDCYVWVQVTDITYQQKKCQYQIIQAVLPQWPQPH